MARYAHMFSLLNDITNKACTFYLKLLNLNRSKHHKLTNRSLQTNWEKHMFLFGVTGGIGSGKTVVCEYLRKKNLPVLNSDSIAKHLINNHPQIQKKLIESFGRDIYSEPNKIDAKKMSRLVFENENARRNINRIVHPFVFEHIKNDSSKLQNKTSLLGVEAALMYESEMEKILNAVIVVDAPFEKRIEWIQQRNNFTRDEIVKRIESQMPAEEKIQLADYVIHNDSDLDALKSKVEILVNWLVKKSTA